MRVALAPVSAVAQSLIVGIPNADTIERGHVSITHESRRPRHPRAPAWNSFFFSTYGVREHVEATLSLTNLSYPGCGGLVLGASLQVGDPGVRGAAPRVGAAADGGAGELVLVGAGGHRGVGPCPRQRAHPAAAHAPDGGGELRLRAAVRAWGRRRCPSWRAWSAPITPWLRGVVDWYSGVHALGAFIPAVQFNIDRVALIVGYKLDNDRAQPRDGIIAEVAVQL